MISRSSNVRRFLESQLSSLCNVRIRLSYPRRFVLTIDLPILRHNPHSKIWMKPAQIVTEQSILGRHVHPALLHILQLRIEHSSELCMGHLPLFKLMKLPVKPSPLLQGSLVQVSPQLRANLREHCICFLRDPIFRLSTADAIIIDSLPRRTILEASSIQVQFIYRPHLLSSSCPTADHIIKTAIVSIKIRISIFNNRACDLNIQSRNGTHLLGASIQSRHIIIVSVLPKLLHVVHQLIHRSLEVLGNALQRIDHIRCWRKRRL